MKTKTENAAPSQLGNPTPERKLKGVWSIIENERLDRPVWIRLGTAFVNRDGSLNIYLDALPINGRLHIRDLEQMPETDTRGKEYAQK